MSQFPSTNSGSNVWTDTDVYRARAGGNWPSGGGYGGPADSSFYDVSLLLTGNGTNGAQNNTFIDSSSNALSIATSGDATQGSFSPYGSGWSNYLTGTGTYLSLSNSSGLDIGASNSPFTVELWYCLNSNAGTQIFFGRGGGAGSWSLTSGWQFVLFTYTGTYIYWQFNYNGQDASIFFPIPTVGQWHHIAIGYDGSTTRLWSDGVSQGTAPYGYYLPATRTTTYIGRSAVTTETGAFNGHISNLRVIKGSDIYGVSNATITVPTAPLTAVPNTTLLTCQSNSFVDNGDNITVTAVGSPILSKFNPFNPTVPYSGAVNGGSAYFDGTTDYITSNTSASLALGTSTFCVEWYEYRTSATANKPAIQGGPGTVNYDPLFGYSNGTNNLLYLSANGSSWGIASAISMGSINLYTWNHFAVTRSGSTFRTFKNGVLIATVTSASSIYQSANRFTVGIGQNTGQAFSGYISDVRVNVGSIPTKYQTTLTTLNITVFIPPTAPMTTTSQGAANTNLLLNMTNAGIPDNAMQNDVQTVGNAQISTSVVKYGTGSLAFDGSGDYIKLGNNDATQAIGFGVGDFTIECWVYPTTSAAANNGIYDCRYSVTATGPTLYNIPSSGLYMFYNGSNVITGSNPTTNTWSHIALVRSSGVTKLYLNGVQTGSNYTDTNNYTSGANSGVAGGFYDGSASFNGYISDLRITRGYARYTTTFTPPTASLPPY